MNYQDRLRAHLVKYKFRVLGVLASGAWKGPRTGAVAEHPVGSPGTELEFAL